MFFCRFIFTVFVVSAFTGFGYSQNVNPDSAYKLPEVKITEDRLNNFSTGQSIIKIDRKKIKKGHLLNLSEIISENTAIFLKSYGQGSLATISIRGTGPAHTGLFWNGININPPNIGLSDFALIPIALINNAEIQLGSSAALYGSGVIGGSVHLTSMPEFKKALNISLSGMAGSFGLYDGSASGTFSNNKWYTHFAGFYQQSDNNFPYINSAKFGKPEERLVSADYFSYGATAEVHRLFKNNLIVSLHAWHTYTHRNLPPSMTSVDNKEQQSDSSFRFLFEAKKEFLKSMLKTKIAWLNESERYDNITASVHDKLSTTGIISEAEFETSLFRKAKLNIGINYTYYSADVLAYQNKKYRNQGAVFLSFLYPFQKINWKATINLRQELVEGYIVPFTPSLGVEGRIWKLIFARANINRSFRTPTMNDRFWQPGGNPNLKPEKGWNAEAGIFTNIQDSAETFLPSLSLTGFSAVIDNWISWQPTNTTFWTPVNLQKVWARGLECNAGLVFKKKKIESGISIYYTYTRSTIVETSTSLESSIGKQLIYIPENSLNLRIDFQWKKINFSYIQGYTGVRFTTSDNKSDLPGYSISNVILNYDFKIKNTGIGLGFRINNIWNVSYQTIAWRPMPGRNFIFSINLNFDKNKL